MPRNKKAKAQPKPRNPQPQPRQQPRQTLYDRLLSTGNKLLDSQISLNTPFGGVGYSYRKGLEFNPQGRNQSSSMTTTSSTGKRQYYYAATAPPRSGYVHGTRVIGCQEYAVMSTLVSTDDTSIGLYLNPDSIGGQMALDARNYSRCIIADVWLEYVPDVQVGYTAAGCQAFTVAYYPDAAIGSFETLSHVTDAACEQSSEGQIWAPLTFHFIPNQEPSLYYTELDTSTATSIRATAQGRLTAHWNSNATATVTGVGHWYIHYVMDLYGRTGDYGFTLILKERKVYEALLRSLFAENPHCLSSRDLNHLHRLLQKENPAVTKISEISSLLLKPLGGEEYVRVEKKE